MIVKTCYIERADYWGQIALGHQHKILKDKGGGFSATLEIRCGLAIALYWRNSNVWDHMDWEEAESKTFMFCPRCDSKDVREVDNLHCVWQCMNCGFSDDGSEFDPEYAGSQDVLDYMWDRFVEED